MERTATGWALGRTAALAALAWAFSHQPQVAATCYTDCEIHKNPQGQCTGVTCESPKGSGKTGCQIVGETCDCAYSGDACTIS